MQVNAENHAQNPDTTAAGHPAAPPEKSLDRIREILQGDSTRQVERRFTRIEEQIRSETTQLRQLIEQRFDATEKEVRAELQKSRDQVLKLEAALEKSNAEWNEKLQQRLKDVKLEALNSIDEQRKAVNESLHEMRVDKLDKIALSTLLANLALQLNDSDDGSK